MKAFISRFSDNLYKQFKKRQIFSIVFFVVMFMEIPKLGFKTFLFWTMLYIVSILLVTLYESTLNVKE